MNSQVKLVDSIRGNTHQTIDADNPPTIGDLARIVGGAFTQAGATFYLSSDSGPQAVPASHTVSVGDTITVAHNVKAGHGI